jgi:hypothetical protein
MTNPEVAGHRGRVHDCFDADQAFFPAGCVGEAFEDFVPGDCAIDDDMTDVDSILGVFLHGLRERSKPLR